MKLVVGLGNPGREHEQNRHNIGFRVLAHWVTSQGARFMEKSEFRGLIAKLDVGGEAVQALLPLTYMNRSGEAIERVMHFFKIGIEDVIVLHDELDIPALTFRVKRGGGHGGHNGLRSIHPLGDGYLRIRLGIGRPPIPQMDVADYVLGDFTLAEQKGWEKLYPSVKEAVELCLAGQDTEAMNRFNRKE